MVATRRCPFITAIGTLMPLAVSAQELEARSLRCSARPPFALADEKGW